MNIENDLTDLLIAESILPHVNASLNALAFVLLCTGYWFIRHGKELAHKVTMISCFAVSIVFLGCYLTYHYGYGHTVFNRELYPAAAYGYYILLATHVPLAALVPLLAIITIYLGLKDRRHRHRQFARWTFPIWLYVSVSGVMVYFMIYWWFPPGAES